MNFFAELIEGRRFPLHGVAAFACTPTGLSSENKGSGV